MSDSLLGIQATGHLMALFLELKKSRGTLGESLPTKLALWRKGRLLRDWNRPRNRSETLGNGGAKRSSQS
jgi:hypothetical protein